MKDKKILITGGAGFIGSNLVKGFLEEGYFVRVLDNLSTGSKSNIKEFLDNSNFEFVEGDIRDFDLVLNLTKDVNYISHQAALGSVPRSIDDPLTSNDVNISGTLNLFYAAKENKIKRVVYAASSSTYGDSPNLPKVEDIIGNPLSPYAVTKYVNELYANVFARTYNTDIIGLRYFNIFGPKQNPKGAYAAVIPLFFDAILNENAVKINGDGTQSRDFTYVENAVQANIRAIEAPSEAGNNVYNIACGEQTSLLELYKLISEIADKKSEPIFGPERVGDVKHSLANIDRARKFIHYTPEFDIRAGLIHAYDWYKNSLLVKP